MEREAQFTQEYVYAMFFKVRYYNSWNHFNLLLIHLFVYCTVSILVQALEGIAESAPQIVLNMYILLVVWEPGTGYRYIHYSGVRRVRVHYSMRDS